MTLLTAVTLLALTGADGWEEASKTEGITVYSRQKEGSDVREVKAVGMIDAPPPEVWKVIRDYPNYKKNMPYTDKSDVIATEGDGKVTYFYSLVNAPLVDKRDYTIKIVDESDWKDGKGYLKATWTFSDKGPKPVEDIIRVTVNDGYWKLEPREDGKKTFATYYLYTNPGGSIPDWIANKANSSAVPDVFRAVRKVAAAAKK